MIGDTVALTVYHSAAPAVQLIGNGAQIVDRKFFGEKSVPLANFFIRLSQPEPNKLGNVPANRILTRNVCYNVLELT